MPILRADMSVDLRRSVVGSDDFDENVLEILFVMLIAKLRESAFGEKFAGLNDADSVAELSTSLMMCVEKMTVLPLLRHSWMKAVMVRAVMTSRPFVGSSKIM